MILLVIGIDGITLRDAAKYGLVDALGATFRWGVTSTHSYTLPSCASFLTGLDPSQHEVTPYGYRNCKSTSETTSALRKFPSYLPTAVYPYRIGLNGVPGTYPPLPLNGWIITGILTPAKAVSIWPVEFANRIRYTGMPEEASLEAYLTADSDTVMNALFMQGELPVDILVHYFSGWNRAYGERTWRQPIIDQMCKSIALLQEATKAPTLIWSDHGNDDLPEGYDGGTQHTNDGLVGTDLNVDLSTNLEEVHSTIVNYGRSLETRIWDRITKRHQKDA